MTCVQAKCGRNRALTRRAAKVFQCVALVGLAACDGDRDSLLGNGRDGEPGANGPDAGATIAREDSEIVPLRRLTRYEYANTVHALLSAEVQVNGVAEQKPLTDMAPLDSLMDALPQDGPLDNLTLFDATGLRTDERHVLAHFQVANLIAERVASDAALYASLTNQACPEATADKTPCAQTLLSTFGARALRRPLSDVEERELLERYKAASASGHGDGVRVMVASLLNSPSFIFHMEDRGTPIDGTEQQLALTSFEKASRLSFGLTGAPPDSVMRLKASSGELDGAEGFAAEVDRVLALPAARRHIKRFFKQWLRIPEDGNLTAFNADFLDGVDVAGVVPKLSAELYAFIDHVVWQTKGDYRALLTSRAAFASDPTIAKIYGVQPGVAGSPIELPATRAGILTRGAMLLGLSEETSPIPRGVNIRRNMLCEPLGLPVETTVSDTELKPLGDETQFSTRQVFEHRTSLPRCQSCHVSINGLGFAFEGFDTIGRFRREERRYNDQGVFVKALPVDTRTIPLIADPTTVSQDAVQLSELVASSDKGPACLTKQWLEYALGSRPSPSGKSDSRDRVKKALVSPDGGSIAGMIRQSAVDVHKAQKPL